MPIPTLSQVWFWLFTVICAAGGAYLGAYLKKKGENLATHEDLDELVAQMKATTEATKAIEARISNQVWDRQKRWELKCDAVIAVTQAMSIVNDSVISCASLLQVLRETSADPRKDQKVMENLLNMNQRLDDFDARRVTASLICSNEFNGTLLKVRETIINESSHLFKDTVRPYGELIRTVSVTINGAFTAARRELGVDDSSAATSQSSESSAVPTPD